MAEYCFAGRADGELLRSADDGATWGSVYTHTAAVTWLAALNVSLYAAVGSNVLRSNDNGVSWNVVYTPPGVTPIVTKIRALNGALYVMDYDLDDPYYHGSVARSTNGTSWSVLSSIAPYTPFGDTGIYLVEDIATVGAQLYAMCAGCYSDFLGHERTQVWGSADGINWSLTGQTATFAAVGYTYHAGQHWSGSTGGIRSSADATTWNLISNVPTNGEPWDDGTTMFITAGDVYRSVDDGANWGDVLATGWFNECEIVKTGAGTFLVAGSAGIFRSTDNGANWDSVHGTQAWSVAVLPAVAARVFWSIW